MAVLEEHLCAEGAFNEATRASWQAAYGAIEHIMVTKAYPNS
jgi:hypothetical protein